MRHHLKLFLSLLLFALPLLAAEPALAAKRLALVIGMNDYKEIPKLEKAVGDAQAIAGQLTALGYAVTTALDLDRRALNLQLAKLYAAIEPGDTVLVHYSGHGIQIENDNYLLPIDVPAPDDGNAELLKSESLRLLTLVDTLGEKGAGARILIIDACRDNPFAKAGKRSIGGSRGLANVATAKGTFIMYSAGAGQSALDRLNDQDPESTSVYTRVLLARLSTPGLKLRDLAASVRDDVEQLGKSVGHDQRPAYYDDLPADFALAPAAAGTGAAQPAIYVPPSVVAPPPKPVLSAEDAFKLSQSIDTVEAWDAFLSQHAESPFAPYAKAARDKLVKKPSPAEPPQQPKVAKVEPKTKSVPAPVDSCNRIGRVRGLDVNGDNFLSVREGPGTGFTEVDRIFTGDKVRICDQKGRWLKIRYGKGFKWVHARYVAG
jgi:hypothetical protein